MYKRILVAVGDSAWSDAAMAYATALAARTGAALRIVTVLTTPATSYEPEMTRSRRTPAEIEHSGQVIATRAAAQAASAGLTYEANCIWGSVPETVLRQSTHCDLIVLGSRGIRGWKCLFAGNIINAVAAKATQPVAVVKTTSDLTASLGRRMLVAVGSSPWSREALEYALQLAQTQGFELFVLHADQMRPRRGEYPTHSDGKKSAHLGRSARRYDRRGLRGHFNFRAGSRRDLEYGRRQAMRHRRPGLSGHCGMEAHCTWRHC